MKIFLYGMSLNLPQCSKIIFKDGQAHAVSMYNENRTIAIFPQGAVTVIDDYSGLQESLEAFLEILKEHPQGYSNGHTLGKIKKELRNFDSNKKTWKQP